MISKGELRNWYERAAKKDIGHTSVPCAFFEIDRTTPREIIAGLVNKDKVHVFGTQTVEDFLAYRLGGPNHTKTSFGIFGPDGEPHVVIYVEKNYSAITSPMDLRGDVKPVLSARVEECKDAPQSLIFYSITNITNKVSAALFIKHMHEHLIEVYPGAALSTLSPMREIVGAVAKEDFLRANTAERHEMVYSYLMKRTDSVQGFHMKNGAVPVAIRLGADTEGEGLQVMVNYQYDPNPDVLRENSLAFRNGGLASLLSGIAPPNAAAVPAMMSVG